MGKFMPVEFLVNPFTLCWFWTCGNSWGNKKPSVKRIAESHRAGGLFICLRSFRQQLAS